MDIASICGGRGLCGRCRVVCIEGDFPKHGIVSAPEHLSPAGAVEARYGERNRPLAPGHRLSCQAAILGDLLIDVPPESQIHRQVVRKDADSRPIRLDPVVRLYLVEVAPADMEGSGSDLTRLLHAMEEQWSLRPAFPAALLAHLQGILRAGAWTVTVAVHQDSEILAIWPGFKQSIYGLAIDVGSTTIAAHLCDLNNGEVLFSNGMMNPQIRFGEDLMSRVSYVMMHPKGSDDLTREVRKAVNELVATTASEASVDPQDIGLTFVGNPIMHHLLLGISPVELGGAPFALAVDESVQLAACDLGLEINPGAVAYVLPCIAGHVGADTAGMVLCEQPHRSGEVSLLVDIGTNAEIVLGNDQRLLACSSPTGPAFEGAQVSAGQRAAPGAIERVRIDPATLETRIRVIGSDLWSDQPGFSDALPDQGVTGICGSGIIEAVAEMWLAGILTSDGVIDGGQAGRTPRLIRDGRTFSFSIHGERVTVTQTDVRQIQLAKAALYAGIRLLMDRLGVASVDRIRLAGAFGSHIDVRYAMALGMIPDCPLDAVSAAGNAAGHGARIALLNRASRREIESVVRSVEKVETAIEPKFQAYFVDAMAIPHRTEAFAGLAGIFPDRVPPPVAARPEQPARARGRRSRH